MDPRAWLPESTKTPTAAAPGLRRCESAEVVNIAPGIWDLGCRACPVVYSPPDSYVHSVRAEYAAWWEAMGELLGRLRAVSFSDHAIVGIAAPARPWEGEARRAVG